VHRYCFHIHTSSLSHPKPVCHWFHRCEFWHSLGTSSWYLQRHMNDRTYILHRPDSHHPVYHDMMRLRLWCNEIQWTCRSQELQQNTFLSRTIARAISHHKINTLVILQTVISCNDVEIWFFTPRNRSHVTSNVVRISCMSARLLILLLWHGMIDR